MKEDHRADPDKILSEILSDKRKPHRGKLKIFFGASAGVGKTYAMLKAAQEELEKGRVVLAGIVETHARPETEHLLEGLMVLQPLEIKYRGLPLREFDLEAALTRKPDVILVDELAHSNAQGCRHPKRWNDVIELLDAGIDVFTTLNVQHVESLSDLAFGATGVQIKETIPDALFDAADDVVLVDIDEDDLLKRLNEGKVYVAPGVKARAAENFFKRSNLIALREMALRRMAERVEAERKEEGFPLTEKILVCIALGDLAPKLLRAARRMAGALKASWTAVYVDTSGLPRLPDEKARGLEALEAMVSRMGGETVILHGDDRAEEIIDYARKNHFTKIMIGKSFRFSFRHLFGGFLVDKIIRQSGAIDVYVVTADPRAAPKAFSASPLERLRPFDYLLTLFAVAGFTIPGAMLPQALTHTDQALLYILGNILVAQTFGLGASLFYAFLAALLFNALFLEPSVRFSIESGTYATTFFVMLAAGLLVALRVSSLHARAILSREKEDKTRALYALTRKLAGTRGRFPVSETVGRFIEEHYDVSATVWMTNSEGHPSVVLGTLPESTYYKDFGALQWCFENTQHAGRGTATMPSAAGFYVPLVSSEGTLGVLGLFPKSEKRFFTSEEISSLETLASLLASALERVRAGEIAQQVVFEKEGEQISPPEPARQSSAQPQADLFSSLKNLRLSSALSLEDEKIASGGGLFSSNPKIAQSLHLFLEEEKTKIKGARLNRRPASLSDILTRVKNRLAPSLGRRRLEIGIPVALPDALVDVALTEQVLFDLLRFALDRSPPLGKVKLDTKRDGSDLLIKIADKGPCLPENALETLFETFEKQDAPSLSVQAGLVRLHGGRIEARNLHLQGLEISLTLPIA